MSHGLLSEKNTFSCGAMESIKLSLISDRSTQLSFPCRWSIRLELLSHRTNAIWLKMYRCGSSEDWSVQPPGDRQRICGSHLGTQASKEDEEAFGVRASNAALPSFILWERQTLFALPSKLTGACSAILSRGFQSLCSGTQLFPQLICPSILLSPLLSLVL